MDQKKKARLVIISNPLATFGGGERWVMEAVTRLKKHFDITILNQLSPKDEEKLSKKEMERRYNLSGVSIVDIESYGINTASISSSPFTLRVPKPKGLAKLKNVIKESDVVYAVSFNPIILFHALRYARKYKKGFIVGLHNPEFLGKEMRGDAEYSGIMKMVDSSIQMNLIKRIGNIHAQTESQMEAIKKSNYKGQLFYIPHYLYLNPEPRKTNTKQKRFTVLFVGRFSTYQKGIDMLDKIIRRVLRYDPGVRFNIIGSGDKEGESLMSRLQKDYQSSVMWFGFVSDKLLVEQYKSSNLFVLPSRYETPGLSLLEAQGYGLPAIAFSVPGPKDIMKDKVQGRLVRPFDIEGFSDEIIRYHKLYISDKRAYGKVYREIQKKISRRYGEKFFVSGFVRMVNTVAKKQSFKSI